MWRVRDELSGEHCAMKVRAAWLGATAAGCGASGWPGDELPPVGCAVLRMRLWHAAPILLRGGCRAAAAAAAMLLALLLPHLPDASL